MAEVFVLVPSYNHASFIERCLKSIFKQTFQPAKLLVIDDGSQDDSVQIIKKVLRDCPFPSEFISQSNRGLCATLNTGFSQSFGEYFAYLGSDDVWLPNFLENRVELLDSRPDAVLAFGHAFLIDEQDKIIDCTRDWTDYKDGEMLSVLLKGIVPASSSVVYRREILAKYKWNENSILEDYELYLKLCGAGSFALDPQILSAWRQHGYNTSGDFAKMMDEWLAAQNRHAAEIGLDQQLLKKIQSELKFNSVIDFIRRGQRVAAFRLLLENWRSATSAVALGKTALRFLVPFRVQSFYQQQRRKKAAARYGNIKV